EKELLEAKRIDPQNKKYDLALATLHVAANDVATHEVGVRELLDLCDDESFRRDAMHRLADDALRRNQITRALDYARELDGLRKFCAGTKWDALDYMRNALAARALREVDQVQESSQEWKEAVAKVGTRSEQIFGLAELVRKWGWQNEAIDLWWLATKDPINAEKTLRMLYDFYADRRDSEELYRVLVHLEKLRPRDRAVCNNLAQISLLLNLDADRAYQLAREVYEQEPKNANYASTYAFSLYLQGDVKRALQVLAGFSEAELERPQIAAYYGVMLANSGDFA